MIFRSAFLIVALLVLGSLADPDRCCAPDKISLHSIVSVGVAQDNSTFGEFSDVYSIYDFTQKGRYFLHVTYTDTFQTVGTYELIVDLNKNAQYFIDVEEKLCIKSEARNDSYFIRCTPDSLNFAGYMKVGERQILSSWKGFGEVDSSNFTGLIHLTYTDDCTPVSAYLLGQQDTYQPKLVTNYLSMAASFFNVTHTIDESYFIPPKYCTPPREDFSKSHEPTKGSRRSGRSVSSSQRERFNRFMQLAATMMKLR